MGTVVISGVSALIFGTTDGAVSYFKTQIPTEGDEWGAASTTLKNQALVSATRWLTRIGLCDSSGTDIVPSDLDTDVPDDVKFATYELAAVLLADPEASTKSSTGSNVRKVQAGSAKVEFFTQTDGKRLPEVAMQLLGTLLKSNASGLIGSVASGADGESSFSELNPYGLTRGYA